MLSFIILDNLIIIDILAIIIKKQAKRGCSDPGDDLMEYHDYEFTKSHTQMAKGIAILLMICHHLFGFPERLHNVYYTSIVPFSNNYFEYLTGRFGKICVAMFLFLSGYGLYMSYMKKNNFTFKDSIKRIYGFLMNYWVAFILFVPIGLIWFSGDTRYSWDLNIFFKNFFTISSSYNSEWWFARLYIEVLLLFPIIKYLINKHIICISLFSALLCLLPLKIYVLFQVLPQLSFIKNNIIYAYANELFFWQIIFISGCIVAKYNLFKVVNTYLSRKRFNNNIFYILFILIVIAARHKIPELTKIDATYVDILITPIFILLCTNIISKYKSKTIFVFLGKNSGNIWLTHTFFVYYYFQKLVFYPKISLIIVIWVCTLTVISSLLINFILLKIHTVSNYTSLKIKEAISSSI